ncbi:MAG: FAD-dependent oxidoreductase [Candidatus Thiodiazotropha sp.]
MVAISPSPRKRVLIVGCGFAGLAAARRFARDGNRNLDLVVFNRTPTLYNYPILPRLLYETLPERLVSPRLEPLLAGLPLTLHTARIETVDLRAQCVTTQSQQFDYDYLILALGSRAVPLDKADDVFVCYPKAARHLARLRDIMRQQALAHDATPVRYVVAGGGLTGVEFAAALRELSCQVCAPLGQDPRHIAIELLERETRLLPGCHPALGRRARRALSREAIDVRTDCRVERVEAGRLFTSQGESPVDQVLCCIGSQPDLRPELHGLAGDGAAIGVDARLRIRGVENAYAVGDTIHFDDPVTPELKRASHARDQGWWAAGNILRQIGESDPLPYRPGSKPTLLMLNPRNGILEYRGLCLGGRWVARLKRHLETRYCKR